MANGPNSNVDQIQKKPFHQLPHW